MRQVLELSVSFARVLFPPTAENVYAVLKERPGKDEVWSHGLSSEMLIPFDSLRFTHSFVISIDTEVEDTRELRFGLFSTSRDVRTSSDTLYAYVSFTVADLQYSSGSMQLSLKHPYEQPLASLGTATITSVLQAQMIRFDICASKLPQKDFFQATNARLHIYQTHRKHPELVYCTPAVRDSSYPHWTPFYLSALKLCGNDHDRPLSFEVTDESPGEQAAVLGNVETTLNLLTSVKGPKTMLFEYSAAALHFLRVQIVDTREPPVEELPGSTMKDIVDGLASISEGVQAICLRALINMLQLDNDARYRKAILLYDGIGKVVDLICSTESPEMIAQACWMIRNMAVSDAKRQALRRHGCIAVLLQCTRHPDMDVLKQALWALSNVIFNNDINRREVVKEGGMPVMMTLLQHADIEVLEQALWFLINMMADNDEIRSHFREKQGFAVLVPLLKSHVPVISGLAAMAIRNLCNHNVKNRNQVRQSNGIYPLVQLLSSRFISVREHAANAVGSVCDGIQANQAQVRDCDGIRALWLCVKPNIQRSTTLKETMAAVTVAPALFAAANRVLAPVETTSTDTASSLAAAAVDDPDPVSVAPDSAAPADPLSTADAAIPAPTADQPMPPGLSLETFIGISRLPSASDTPRHTGVAMEIHGPAAAMPTAIPTALGTPRTAVDVVHSVTGDQGVFIRNATVIQYDEAAADTAGSTAGSNTAASTQPSSQLDSLPPSAVHTPVTIAAPLRGAAVFSIEALVPKQQQQQQQQATTTSVPDGVHSSSQLLHQDLNAAQEALQLAAIACLQVLVHQNETNRRVLQRVAGKDYRADLFG
eukprot:TRINITY_DN4329_c0_g1_i1.p1 TRINITY_DN4329_c0_g1~~TRINITY_DN4329_c0_g1_i1.p1  ORF type:complete len:824 (-),score=200.68 TRINITY_DN4329_c0_g1_i1:1248-3719(-)